MPRSSPAALPASAPRPRACWPRPAPRSRSSTSIAKAAADGGDRNQRPRRSIATSPTAPTTEAAIAKAAADHGPARILINCAGIGPAKRIVGRDGPMPLADFERVIRDQPDRHLQRACGSPPPPCRARPARRTASAASSSAPPRSRPIEGQIGQAAYAASKGGVVGARDAGGARIRPVRRPRQRHRARHFLDADAACAAGSRRRRASPPRCRFPKKLGDPSQFAALVRHMIENRYLNGEVVRLDAALRMAPR